MTPFRLPLARVRALDKGAPPTPEEVRSLADEVLRLRVAGAGALEALGRALNHLAAHEKYQSRGGWPHDSTHDQWLLAARERSLREALAEAEAPVDRAFRELVAARYALRLIQPLVSYDPVNSHTRAADHLFQNVRLIGSDQARTDLIRALRAWRDLHDSTPTLQGFTSAVRWYRHNEPAEDQ